LKPIASTLSSFAEAFGVRRSAFGVRRSAFGVRRSAFGVRRSAFGVRANDCLFGKWQVKRREALKDFSLG
jgi:hypothetical protein